RAFISSDRYDRSLVELEDLLLTAGVFSGYEPPEAAKWRAAAALRKKRQVEISDGSYGKDMRERWLRDGTTEAEPQEPPPSPWSRAPLSTGDLPELVHQPPPAPYRSPPKVGRND